MAASEKNRRFQILLPQSVFADLQKYADLIGTTHNEAASVILGKHIRTLLREELENQGALVVRKGMLVSLETWVDENFDQLSDDQRSALKTVDEFLKHEAERPIKVGDVVTRTIDGRVLVVTRIGKSGQITGTRWDST